ncbi:hypothetical protein AB0942_33395 [Streptomyces nodosus]|uniref:hypothetical protein n=1 Tax=Streptomyces nodosus TaxID=40318 RepID=UPI003454C9C4
MSDNHRGLPHDLAEYVPNLPLAADVRRQVRSKARVRKGAFGKWSWEHDCGPYVHYTGGLPAWSWAFGDALKHVKGCR